MIVSEFEILSPENSSTFIEPLWTVTAVWGSNPELWFALFCYLDQQKIPGDWRQKIKDFIVIEFVWVRPRTCEGMMVCGFKGVYVYGYVGGCGCGCAIV